jgi:hypothetical protein
LEAERRKQNRKPDECRHKGRRNTLSASDLSAYSERNDH